MLRIYVRFVLHNFCELNNEVRGEEHLKASVSYNRDFQPDTDRNRYLTDCNESEGKRVRKVLTVYFDP